MANLKYIFGIFLLFGCAGLDNYVAKSPNNYWQSQSQSYNSSLSPNTDLPDPDMTEKLSLPEILDIALKNNTQTRIAWHEAKTAAADKILADSAYYPSVSASLGFEQTNRNQNFDKKWGGLWLLTPSVSLNYMLFNFGARSGAANAAAENLKAANYSYNRTLQNLVLEVTQSFYNLSTTEADLIAANANLKDTKTTYEAASKRLEIGLGSKQDELLALSNFRASEYALEDKEAAVETARANLAKLIGLKISENLKIDNHINFNSKHSDQTSVQHSFKKQDIHDLLNQAINNRPDLRASEASSEAALSLAKAAKWSLWPSLNLTFGSTLNEEISFQESPNLNLSAALSVNWDIFSGFSERSKYLKNKQLYYESQEALKQEELNIYAGVWSAFYSYEAAQKGFTAASALLIASQESFDAMRESYINGLSTLINLVQAQDQLNQARSTKISANAKRITSLAKLSNALGKNKL